MEEYKKLLKLAAYLLEYPSEAWWQDFDAYRAAAAEIETKQAREVLEELFDYAQELGKPTYGYEEGIIKFQPAIRKKENPGLGSGWDWAADDGTQGYDFTIYYLQRWLGVETDGLIGPNTIKALQTHYGITADGRLDGPSDTIKALQNELNQHVS